MAREPAAEEEKNNGTTKYVLVSHRRTAGQLAPCKMAGVLLTVPESMQRLCAAAPERQSHKGARACWGTGYCSCDR